MGITETPLRVGVAVILNVPEIDVCVQEPVVKTVKVKTPETEGVPLIVNTPALYELVNPEGNPITPAPEPPPPML